MKTDWKKIKTDFLKGMSRKEVCEKYGINYKTLDSRITKEKWIESVRKVKGKTQEKLEEKISESLAERQAKLILKQEGDSLKFWQKSLEFLPMCADPSEGKTTMEMFEKAVKLTRQAMGISDKLTIESENKGDIRMISVNLFN